MVEGSCYHISVFIYLSFFSMKIKHILKSYFNITRIFPRTISMWTPNSKSETHTHIHKMKIANENFHTQNNWKNKKKKKLNKEHEKIIWMGSSCIKSSHEFSDDHILQLVSFLLFFQRLKISTWMTACTRYPSCLAKS